MASPMQQLIKWDLKTCTVGDLSFTRSVRLTSSISGTIHGLTASFDCDMIKGEGVKFGNVLSTSPFEPQTHWKQTTFLFDHPVEVKVGDVINGSMRIKRRIRNERELEVVLKLEMKQNDICNQTYSVS